MATRFEIVLHGDDPARLRAAGEEALREIERLDAQLSFYRPDSEISWINARAAREPVKVEPRLFGLLQMAADLHDRTDGAFDVTVGPLMRAWGFVDGEGGVPDPAGLQAARAVTGMRHVRLAEDAFEVMFDRDGVQIDLGAIGKGHAIECAVESLRASSVEHALIHGGTSTIYGLGRPPDCEAWRVTIAGSEPDVPGQQDGLCLIDLRDSALSVSAIRGKSFAEQSRIYGHVIDPRTGRPVEHTLSAAVSGPSPTVCDALSTALLVLGEAGLDLLVRQFPGYTGRTIAA